MASPESKDNVLEDLNDESKKNVSEELESLFETENLETLKMFKTWIKRIGGNIVVPLVDNYQTLNERLKKIESNDGTDSKAIEKLTKNLESYENSVKQGLDKIDVLSGKLDDKIKLSGAIIKKYEETIDIYKNGLNDFKSELKEIKGETKEFNQYIGKISELEKRIEEGIAASHVNPEETKKQIETEFSKLIKGYLKEDKIHEKIEEMLEPYVKDKEIKELSDLVGAVKVLDQKVTAMDAKWDEYKSISETMKKEYKRAKGFYKNLISIFEQNPQITIPATAAAALAAP